jgi:hypothetical protein
MVSTTFAKTLLDSANSQPQDMDISFREVSLTGNMDIEEMLKRKIQWKTMDDHEKSSIKLSYGIQDNTIVLEAQRIRVFEISYTPKTAMFLN